MTKKDGATERVQAISDVCHGLRHAHSDANVWFHSRNPPWLASSSQRAQGGESESSRGVQWCEPSLPSWTLGRVNKDSHAATERPGPVLDSPESCRLRLRCSPGGCDLGRIRRLSAPRG